MEHKEFRQRISAFEKGEVLWRACPDRLERHGADGALQLTIPYNRVRRVRIAGAPSRGQPARLLMKLTGERSRLTVSNKLYIGFANFEDREEGVQPGYRPRRNGGHRLTGQNSPEPEGSAAAEEKSCHQKPDLGGLSHKNDAMSHVSLFYIRRPRGCLAPA
ncbi:hypothetical protein ACQKH5_09645 [Hyphomonas sp. NPDC076900]|uniref:hypothetical protein n=1 Tax=unclassified Hyphomonas TaxID=2630699 RepID=UPI003D05BCB2